MHCSSHQEIAPCKDHRQLKNKKVQFLNQLWDALRIVTQWLSLPNVNIHEVEETKSQKNDKVAGALKSLLVNLHKSAIIILVARG